MSKKTHILFPSSVVPRSRLLEHDPVAGDHNPGDGDAERGVRGRGARARRGHGPRQNFAHGRHGAVRAGAARGHEAAVGGRRRAELLQPLQRVSAERLGQVLPGPAGRDRTGGLPAEHPGHFAHARQDDGHRRNQLLVQGENKIINIKLNIFNYSLIYYNLKIFIYNLYRKL